MRSICQRATLSGLVASRLLVAFQSLPRVKAGVSPAAGTPQIGSVINHFAVNQSSDVAPCRAEDGAFDPK